MAGSFSRAIGDFADKTADQMNRVMKQSIQEVINDAQTPVAKDGNMPVDQSFLRNSLASELDGTLIAQGENSHTLTIAQMKIGQPARFGWTAAYARARHYLPAGPGRQGGGHWRDIAVGKWQQIVRKNARLVE